MGNLRSPDMYGRAKSPAFYCLKNVIFENDKLHQMTHAIHQHVRKRVYNRSVRDNELSFSFGAKL